MAIITEYHQYLFFGKITNSLTADESAELEEFFLKFPDATAEYEELLATLPPQSVATSYNFLNQDNYWKELETGFKRKSSGKQIWMKKLSIAAIAIGIIATTGALFLNNKNKNPSKNNAVALNKNKEYIELKLSNGKVINLSETKGEIKEGEILLDNSNESLSYQAIGSTKNGMNSVIVPTGMDYKIRLGDGSLVWMNSTTQLEFPTIFATDKREISITGEAYLEIAKDAAKPFIVHLPNASVKVLGTSFNVNSYDTGMVRVALVEGKVNLSSNTASVNVNPGMEAVYNDQSGKILQQVFEAKNTLSWQKGLYFFEEATLSDLSKVLTRWFGVTTIIDNTDLQGKKFAGILDKNKSIDIFLRNLKIISGIDSHFDKDGVLHFK